MNQKSNCHMGCFKEPSIPPINCNMAPEMMGHQIHREEFILIWEWLVIHFLIRMIGKIYLWLSPALSSKLMLILSIFGFRWSHKFKTWKLQIAALTTAPIQVCKLKSNWKYKRCNDGPFQHLRTSKKFDGEQTTAFWWCVWNFLFCRLPSNKQQQQPFLFLFVVCLNFSGAGDFHQLLPVAAKANETLYSSAPKAQWWANSINCAVFFENNHRFRQDPNMATSWWWPWKGAQ